MKVNADIYKEPFVVRSLFTAFVQQSAQFEDELDACMLRAKPIEFIRREMFVQRKIAGYCSRDLLTHAPS